MIGTPKRLSGSECHTRLAVWAACADAAGGDPGQTERVVADYLRHALCHLGLDADGGRIGAVHVLRLLSSIRRQLQSWIPDAEQPPWIIPAEADAHYPEDLDDRGQPPDIGDVTIRALHHLTLLGDCAHCGDGYYLPTPLRLVPLPSGRALLIGGLPTRPASDFLSVPVGWAGLARGVAAEHMASAESRVPRQPLDAWLMRPAQPLAVWTAEVLGEAQQRGMASPGADPSSFEVYAPHLQANQRQINRWVPAKTWRASGNSAAMGLALCRTRARPRRFWLAPLVGDAHGPTFSREAPMPPERVRRLMYGFDQLAGATVLVRALAVVGRVRGEREVRLFNWPAREEYKLLAALAFDTTPPEGPFLPIRYCVAPEWWPDVRTVLEGLSVRIKDETGLNT